MTAVTYAEARAACVARYGEPVREYTPHLRARWVSHACDLWLESDGAIVRLETVSARGPDHPAPAWTLAGDPAPNAPLTPLPAALDAADAFLRTHAHPTKGP